MHRNAKTWIALAAAALVLLTACGGSSQSAGSSQGAGSGQSAPAGGSTAPAGGSAAPAPAAKKKVTIGLAMPAVSTAFWVSMNYGVEDEAKKQGADLIVVDAGGFDQTAKQISQIQNLVQRGVDVLLVGATDGKAVAPAVEQAIAQGTPVIGLSSLPATDKLAATIGADHYGMGVFDARCLADKIGGSGEVAMMSGPPGVNWAIERDNGFKETIQKNYPNIKIVAEKTGPSERAQGMKLMEDWLQAFPNLKGVFGVTDDLGAGAADALAAAGKTGKIRIATANLSQVGKEYLEVGKIDCQAAQTVVTQGRVAVRTAIAIANKQPYQKDVKTQAIGITQDKLATMDMSEIAAPADYRPH